jgi:transcriptional regulator with XRE-family HTH domain
MPNTTNWREIRQRRPPNETAAALEKLQLRLAMLREQVGASQVDVAEALGTSQSNVSQLERSNDQMLSSIAKYVHALGGELKMTAVVGDTTYTLLDDVSELAPRRTRSRRTRSKKTPVQRKAPVARAARKATAAPKASAHSRTKETKEIAEA